MLNICSRFVALWPLAASFRKAWHWTSPWFHHGAMKKTSTKVCQEAVWVSDAKNAQKREARAQRKASRGVIWWFHNSYCFALYFTVISSHQLSKHHLSCGFSGPRRTIYPLAAVRNMLPEGFIFCKSNAVFGCKGSGPRSHDVSWFVFLPATWQSFVKKSLTHLDLNLTGHTNIIWIQYALSALGQ